jgi:hypothetical protein
MAVIVQVLFLRGFLLSSSHVTHRFEIQISKYITQYHCSICNSETIPAGHVAENTNFVWFQIVKKFYSKMYICPL